jgi:hypothetical protein
MGKLAWQIGQKLPGWKSQAINLAREAGEVEAR